MILSKKQKDDIIHRALTDTFSETVNKIEQLKVSLADNIYDYYFPQEIIEMMPHFPTGIFIPQKLIFVNFYGNYSSFLNLSSNQLYPKNYEIYIEEGSEFYTQHMEIANMQVGMENDYYEMKRLLLELFSRKSDDMEIAEEWPGIMNYVEDYVEDTYKDPVFEKSITSIEEKYKLEKEVIAPTEPEKEIKEPKP